MTELKAVLQDISFTLDGKQLVTFCVKGDVKSLFEKYKEKNLSLTVKTFRKKRSLDANSYFWLLCDKLAEKLKIPKSEIYRGYIKEIGGNNETVCVKTEVADKIIKGWQHNGLGWIAEEFPSKLKDCIKLTLYMGSSEYDTAQMSRLIDLVVADCKEQGIETLTPMELERLKGEWK